MNNFRYARSLKVPVSLIWFSLVPVACTEPVPEEVEGPQEEGFSRFPAITPTQDLAPDNGPNPWISGSGGEASVGGGFGTQSSGGTSSHVDPGADPNDNPDSDSESAPHGTGGGGNQVIDSSEPDSSESDQEVDEEEPNEPEPLLQRRFIRYLEGEGTDKLLEVWGEAGVSPIECRVEIYSNGGTDPWRSIPLPGEFPVDGGLTLCSLPESHPECTAPLSGSLYNGNDALVLVCGDVVMDSFGRVGEDPGVAWTSDDKSLSSEGQELIRCGESPRVDPFAPFALADEWVLVENGESPEDARLKCEQLGAPKEGGAGASAL